LSLPQKVPKKARQIISTFFELAKESSQRKRFALRRKFRLRRTAAIVNTNAYAYPSFTLPLFLVERKVSATQKLGFA
jgi:hypothetical protein